MRGGTNTLRIEVEGEALQDRTCLLCARKEVEDEVHVLLSCSAYMRERRDLYQNILKATNYDLNVMRDNQDWLVNILIGIGCEQRWKRHQIQLEVANYLEVIFRKRTRILDQIQGQI